MCECECDCGYETLGYTLKGATTKLPNPRKPNLANIYGGIAE